MSNPILLLAGRNRYEKKRTAKSPVPDTACQSSHRKVRLVLRVDHGLGCRLHPLQRLCQTHRPYREVVVMWGSRTSCRVEDESSSRQLVRPPTSHSPIGHPEIPAHHGRLGPQSSHAAPRVLTVRR